MPAFIYDMKFSIGAGYLSVDILKDLDIQGDYIVNTLSLRNKHSIQHRYIFVLASRRWVLQFYISLFTWYRF